VIAHKFDTGIKDATGRVHWAMEAFDDAEDALAYGLEWAALRIRDGQPRVRKILVCHTVIDEDYGIKVSVDAHYMTVKIKQD
jgi:hypothetical protein